LLLPFAGCNIVSEIELTLPDLLNLDNLTQTAQNTAIQCKAYFVKREKTACPCTFTKHIQKAVKANQKKKKRGKKKC